jgi:peptidoglycan hydrolase-like protein with peptidoglycan-binding domain
MVRRNGRHVAAGVAGLLGVVLLVGGCGVSLGGRQASGTSDATAGGTVSESPSSTSSAPAPTTTTDVPSTTTTSSPSTTATKSPTPTTTTTTSTPKPTVKADPKPGDTLHVGDKGAYVKQVQQRLSALGYWNGTADGVYGHQTSQAVMALQKAAGIGRDGIFGPATARALERGIRPSARVGGTGIEIDKARQLLLVVRGGAVTMVLNTSTGSNQPYKTQGGGTAIATTPSGTFRVFRVVDALDRGPLGDLWRPRYFNGGIAVHGSGSIPGFPASHGCARVSNAAMNMIWANNLMPIGSQVTVY